MQHVGETATVFAAPPLPGACSLMLFGKKRDEPEAIGGGAVQAENHAGSR